MPHRQLQLCALTSFPPGRLGSPALWVIVRPGWPPAWALLTIRSSCGWVVRGAVHLAGQLKNYKTYKLQAGKEQERRQQQHGGGAGQQHPIGTPSWGQLSKFISLKHIYLWAACTVGQLRLIYCYFHLKGKRQKSSTAPTAAAREQ